MRDDVVGLLTSLWNIVLYAAQVVLGFSSLFYGIQGEYAQGAYSLGWLIVIMIMNRENG